MRILFTILIIASSFSCLYGIIPYTVNAISEDYTELINPIAINGNQVWDNNSVFPINFDFDFQIDGKNYNSLNIKAGGIEFVGYGNLYLLFFHSTTYGHLLKDRGMGESESPIGYLVDGDIGERILKIEWKNAGFIQGFSTSSIDDFINFQIWLYEEDNHIELHFGESNTDAGTYGYPEVQGATGPRPMFKCSADSSIMFNGVADNPNYFWVNQYEWNYNINSTPSENIAYVIIPGSAIVNDILYKYSFEKTTQDYVPLSNPTMLTSSQLWDNNQSYIIDFDFIVYDQHYNTISVLAGGGISFSGVEPRSLQVYHTVFGGYLLQSKGELESTIGYEISGSVGARILKIQWENAGFVQWYPTSDSSDYVDFQIWLFESDHHLEIHFGGNATDPGTYGYPDATSDANPGPGIRFQYDNCSSNLCVTGFADNPSWSFYDFCTPNQTFVDGTPSEGTTYIFNTENITSVNNNNLTTSVMIFPNPLSSEVNIKNCRVIRQIRIIETTGKIVYTNNCVNEKQITIELGNLKPGLYMIEILDAEKSCVYKVIK